MENENDSQKVDAAQRVDGARVKETHVNNIEDADEVASNICCLKGCISSSIIAFLFFVMLPSGILLILYADKNDNHRILPVGILLVCLPFIVTPVLIYVLLHWKQLKKCRNKYKTEQRNDST